MKPALRIIVTAILVLLLSSALYADDKDALVKVSGEVVFPGEYLLDKQQMRIMDLIKDAGGLTEYAHRGGIYVMRTLTDNEYSQMMLACQLALEQLADYKVILQIPSRSDRYSIPLDYDMAVASPISKSNIVLRDGDQIHVSKLDCTIKISGAVQYPTVVTFVSDASLRDYLQMAGGFAKGAARGKIYAISQNGEIIKKQDIKKILQPGCEIVVPWRKENVTITTLSVNDILGITMSTNSVTEMVIKIIDKTTK